MSMLNKVMIPKRNSPKRIFTILNYFKNQFLFEVYFLIH
ncbi:hypothetical protein EW15_1994 [Prochlorococcus sp. MIT 0801]|nr:hypothetical protein EW15_1994 [Prochlorococcus sp. MIT 0801]